MAWVFDEGTMATQSLKLTTFALIMMWVLVLLPPCGCGIWIRFSPALPGCPRSSPSGWDDWTLEINGISEASLDNRNGPGTWHFTFYNRPFKDFWPLAGPYFPAGLPTKS